MGMAWCKTREKTFHFQLRAWKCHKEEDTLNPELLITGLVMALWQGCQTCSLGHIWASRRFIAAEKAILKIQNIYYNCIAESWSVTGPTDGRTRICQALSLILHHSVICLTTVFLNQCCEMKWNLDLRAKQLTIGRFELELLPAVCQIFNTRNLEQSVGRVQILLHWNEWRKEV